MDTPVTSTPMYLHTERHTNLKRVAFVVIIISAIITIAAYGVPYLSHTASPGASSSTSFAVSVGPAPMSVLYTVDAKTKTLVPLTVHTSDGRDLHAVDVQKGTDGSWYYILSEPTAPPVGNVYVKKSDGSVTKLTDSPTIKYNLSYDAVSGKLAYQALAYTNDKDFFTNTMWNLTVFDLASKAETIIGKGMNPHLASGGSALMFEHGDELEAISLSSHATSSVIKIVSGSIYAINPTSTMVSVYNPVTHKVDHFKFVYGTSLSYVSSVNTLVIPTVMGYVGDTIVVANSSKKDADVYYSFSRPDSMNAPIVVKGLPYAIPQRIYAYE